MGAAGAFCTGAVTATGAAGAFCTGVGSDNGAATSFTGGSLAAGTGFLTAIGTLGTDLEAEIEGALVTEEGAAALAGDAAMDDVLVVFFGFISLKMGLDVPFFLVGWATCNSNSEANLTAVLIRCAASKNTGATNPSLHYEPIGYGVGRPRIRIDIRLHRAGMGNKCPLTRWSQTSCQKKES